MALNSEWPKFLTTLSLKLFSICSCNRDRKDTETRPDEKMFDPSNKMTTTKEPDQVIEGPDPELKK